MMNLYSFIQGSLEWPFSELFSANVSLLNQYKYIAFKVACVVDKKLFFMD